jgi:hypothetical protein
VIPWESLVDSTMQCGSHSWESLGDHAAVSRWESLTAATRIVESSCSRICTSHDVAKSATCVATAIKSPYRHHLATSRFEHSLQNRADEMK